MGPFGLDLLDTNQWSIDRFWMLEQFSRGTLAIGLMGVALRLPARTLFRRWRTLMVLLFLAMPLSMCITAGCVHLLVPLSWSAALFLGAIASPTDPVVASSIVTGRYAERVLPLRLRRVISAESGVNDGLAFPLVFLPLALLEEDIFTGLSTWLIQRCLVQVLGGVLLGGIIGQAAGYLLRVAERRHSIRQRSLLGFTLALTLCALGAAYLLGVDDVLAVFVAGLAFDLETTRQDQQREEKIQETVNQFFSVPIFALFGVMLPYQAWMSFGPTSIICCLAILVVRRLPVLFLLRNTLPALPACRDLAFSGWFGPLGVAAIFYIATLNRIQGDTSIWEVGSLMIVTSVVAHGISATPLTKLYRRAKRSRSCVLAHRQGLDNRRGKDIAC
jgi:NhaP-type Na+/H+ or K+/H+ antiporter